MISRLSSIDFVGPFWERSLDVEAFPNINVWKTSNLRCEPPSRFSLLIVFNKKLECTSFICKLYLTCQGSTLALFSPS
jgi:hypothetical protein